MIAKSIRAMVVLASILGWLCLPPVLGQSPKTSSAEKEIAGDSRSTGPGVSAETALERPSAFHNWAEFFEAGRWNLVDPQRKRFKEKSSDYIAMRLLAEDIHPEIGRFQRFRIQGDGLAVKMNP